MDQAWNYTIWGKKMSASEGNRGKMKISSSGNEGMGCFSRLVITILVLAVIFLAGVFFAVRTTGGRSFIEYQLSKRLGMELTIEKASIGWPYVLVIDKLISKNFGQENKSGFKAQEIRIARGIKPKWRISVQRCVLNLAHNSDGTWSPEYFCRLGDLPLKNITEISHVTAGLRKNMALHIRESSIRWFSEQDKAFANGVSFDVMPIKIADQKMYYYYLSLYNMSDFDGSRVNDIERKWLSSDLKDYIELETGERIQRDDELQ